LVDKEGALRLDGTMGTGMAVARLFSGLEFSCVVLDFFFYCHNLEMDFVLGDALRSFTVWCAPFFISPMPRNTAIVGAPKIRGRGPILRKTGRGSKRAARAAGYCLREK
jgi:hypothetical protein